MKSKQLVFAVSILSFTSLVSFAGAVDIYGLSTRNQLVKFSSSNPGNLTNAVFINGLASNEALVGIDFRVANGLLYGVGSFGNIYTLNSTTGAATFVAGLTNSIGGGPLALQGTEFGVDFNPVADRLRITSDLDQNLRVNVATGVTTVDGSLNPGNPNIVASAYTFNDTNTGTGTTLYNVDSVTDMLTIQNPPNNGTQTNVGWLGLDVSGLAGMDIQTIGNTNTAFAAFQLANGTTSSLYTINLSTGASTAIGTIGSSQSSETLAIRDITAAVPEPGTMAALALGIGAFLRRRKK
ncbi:MAG: DUF4394 domain-containing protein [Fimbriimonadaceae bacterium]